MMTSGRRLLIGSIAMMVLGLVTAGVLVAASSRSANGPVEGGGPVAVVLVPDIGGSRIVVVDLEHPGVIRTVRLRSLATDAGADVARGVVVGAQTGGLGAAADDAVSLTDPRTGEVRYVTLPKSDPSQVEVIGDRAYLLHTWVDASGRDVSVVDVGAASVVATGHVPEGPGLWAAGGGSMWTSVATDGAGPWALARVDPDTLDVTPVDSLDWTVSGVVSRSDAAVAFGGPASGGAGDGRVALIDRSGGVTSSAPVAGLSHGTQIAAFVSDRLVLGDWDGEAPESDALVVLDGRTLQTLGRLHVGTAPCALAGYRDRLLVVDRVEGVLRQVDPVTGSVEWSVGLGIGDLICSQVLVFDSGASAESP